VLPHDPQLATSVSRWKSSSAGPSQSLSRVSQTSTVPPVASLQTWAPAEQDRVPSTQVVALARDLARIGPSVEPVLVLAETGAGKEVVADALHRLSGRSGKFRAVDCGAVPENLFESTFFGHRKGAFTGAEEARTGEIALADRGTLFLDEVGNMSAAAQAKLLRVMETGKVTPVGAANAETVDVRWVAATNRDLFAEDGSFRQDLLRRLAGYTARLPPLRRRAEDLGVLTAHLLREAGIAKAAITPAAARALYASAFPGNIRQLRTSLRAAALLAADKAIDLAHLPATGGGAGAGSDAAEPSERGDSAAKKRVKAPTAAELEAVLAAAGGNVVRAAEQLGTHPRQLYRWLERYAISLDKYRE